MTRQGILNGLYEIKNWKCNGDAKMHEVIVNAIEALSAEPCEDAISRESALMALTGINLPTDQTKLIALYNERIKALPSVKAEPQTAEWIDYADKIDAKFGRHDYVCPKCNEYARRFVGGSEDWWCVIKPNYCPNCGAKMKGNKHE